MPPQNFLVFFKLDYIRSYEYGDGEKESTAAGTNLKSLVSEMRIMLRATKDHWTNLPHAVCDDVAAPADSQSCWNGESEEP